MGNNLPFKPWDRVIELGGGDKPRFRPNVDVRWVPFVDIIADFNHELPIQSEFYDGVYCQYCLEHLSWRRVGVFLHSVHRILKPGGIAVFITANLLEQARRLVEAKEWDDKLVSMVFGDQDYEANTHRAGFSPEYAQGLFKEAGFYRVEISPLPECATDMVIIAWKSKAEVRVG